ncbi:hypothetical protein CATMIT_01108 [Catenibacterium mitsuokai DSM 15897]|jgi:hypothetical protein|uniref:hypothetical protein n=1 Tax=Catenibacterium mitsuokai TaxID=100886 RepID=UPI000196BC32|nr:hypothetical protein [Catenibacterium mitsuokai]EEF94274.1 hypothetical protein CATMIT_01108 [Catenibacterium mitsuokai DSM 15897]UWO52242.1 hypothetical protein NQ499_08125 [Catenibacterium mitsuokai]
MTPEGLKFISKTLKPLVNYHFLYYKTDKVEYPYWVGEYLENEYSAETNYQGTTFILTGVTRGSYLELEKQKEIIKKALKDKRAILSNGAGIAVHYDYSMPIRTDDIELQKIQINLTIQEWEV